MFTTLFPHLGQQKVHEFRWAFIGGVAVIFVLYLLGLIVPAIVASAVLVPFLYILYLYETQVYRDEPALVLGATIVGGIILGIIATLVLDGFVNPLAATSNRPPNAGTLIGLAVVLPIVQEILKPIPALVLRGRAAFGETADGLVFGIAAGLGYSLAETLVRFWSALTNLPVRTDPGEWIFPLLTLAILQPLLYGSTAGAITAAIWRFGRARTGAREIGAIVAALVAHVAFVLGSQLLTDAGFTQMIAIAWQAVVVGAMLVYVRYLLHHALLEEATHMGLAETVCPNCHRHIMAAGFCPTCGVALSTAPDAVKRARRPRTADGAAVGAEVV